MDYNKLLEKARKVCAECVTNAEKRKLESVFPELAESEDIGERLINTIKSSAQLDYYLRKEGFKVKEVIAWLEKQCEQKPADKVEPKFKVGDWIVDNRTGIVHYIANIKGTVDGCYYVVGGCYCVLGYDKGLLHIDNENDYHLWTIQDAKDGDVLDFDCGVGIFKNLSSDGYNAHCYCYYDRNGQLETNDCSLYDIYEATPATKEQRDQLEKAITDAGYEFDFEKKELKKVEQNPADKCVGCNNVKGCVTCVDGSEWAHVSELNPAWSEEDITNYSKVLFCLQTLTFPTDNERKELITWLEKQSEPQTYKGDSDAMRKNLIKAFKSVGSNHWGGFDVRDIIHFLESKDAIELEKQGEQKPTKKQVWDYCNKISSEWWQITMNKWETLTDEEKSEYNQYIGFNDFSDVLMNITAGALFRLIDTGKLEYEEGSLLLEKPDDTPKPLEVVNAINKKQGEQKPADLPKGKDYGIDGLYNAVRILEKTLGKVEGYQSDDGILEHKCAIDVVKNLYEKNHTWSEDDEKMMQYILKLKYIDVSDYIFQNIKTWLKSLRDRVQPQPKQEWSEEDEVMLQTTIDTLEDFIKGKLPLSGSGYDIAIAEIEWLKSLKPQSHWKPTNEQLGVLQTAIKDYGISREKNVLKSLYNNLKKL